jgi:hypothetical protein
VNPGAPIQGACTVPGAGGFAIVKGSLCLPEEIPSPFTRGEGIILPGSPSRFSESYLALADAGVMERARSVITSKASVTSSSVVSNCPTWKRIPDLPSTFACVR